MPTHAFPLHCHLVASMNIAQSEAKVNINVKRNSNMSRANQYNMDLIKWKIYTSSFQTALVSHTKWTKKEFSSDNDDIFEIPFSN